MKLPGYLALLIAPVIVHGFVRENMPGVRFEIKGTRAAQRRNSRCKKRANSLDIPFATEYMTYQLGPDGSAQVSGYDSALLRSRGCGFKGFLIIL